MASPAGYAELHAKSYFSFLEGASSPEELIRCAQERGLSALALTVLCRLTVLRKKCQTHVGTDTQLAIGRELRLSSTRTT